MTDTDGNPFPLVSDRAASPLGLQEAASAHRIAVLEQKRAILRS